MYTMIKLLNNPSTYNLAKEVRAVSRKRRKKRKRSNFHHIFFRRRPWDVSEARVLRYHPYCIAMVRVEDHEKIHLLVDDVPIPRKFVAECTVRHLDRLIASGDISPEKDSLKRKLEVLIAVLDGIEHSTVEALRRQLCVVDGFKKAPG